MKDSVIQIENNASSPAKRKTRKLSAVTLLLLLASFFALPVFAQNIRVKGQITNDANQPVTRPSILVKGTTTGVTGDDNGNFDINAPSNGTLVISAIDFITQEVKINGRTTLNISLVSLEKSLGEVVVVGYGTQRKEAVTGSVASINGDKMREIPAPNISQALQGRLAGVEMSQNSTRPGATMQIRS
ncbi:MAG: carboxypeptidase-like regulatory domain-containing protein [Bacteroidota bacterium]